MNMNADLNLNVTRRSEKDMPMNMKSHSGHRRLALLIALAITAVPLAAQAQRKSPLADAPAIRKRYELRASRLEIGAGFGSTINQDFYHTLFFNLKLGFHFNDWFSASLFGGFAVSNIATTFQNDLVDHLNSSPAPTQPAFEPTRQDAINSMQKINNILGAQLEFTPFTGKYSLAGVLFANYDFYLFGGGGGISVSPTNSAAVNPCAATNTATGGAQYYCGVSGTKFAFTFGLGLHSYFNHWMALNVELRDMLAQLNPSGRDSNGDLHATTADLSWTHTYLVAANIVFYLPSTPGISP
ncbi:MAG TPA: outer membrane beta-barrel domain-containing protein [Polyangia bacterium]|jgi:outer membrane beta-barrel protein|nr:outer membrane beta-barrel domain-containing protein [Polyangia bacterium]